MTTFNEQGFKNLGLNPDLLKALETEGYTTPTPIQAQGIPVVLSGKDLLGIAQTGTGKTAAFALPILHRLAANPTAPMRKSTRVLVLSPTRELATQIAESFKTYGRHLGLKVVTIFGGVGMKPQINALAGGVDVIVATPGRLLDHMATRTLTLDGTEVLVVDEADQMMDLGFIRPLRQIIAKIPQRRQTLFFSATMPHEIGALAAELLRDPVKVSVTPVAKTADRVDQKIIYIEQPKKRALLAELFGDEAMTRTLVFTRTKRGADRVARHLESVGIKCAAIHGNKSQGQREQALAAFKASKIRALIATDIAARGIDIDQVSHVINFELPNIPESYVHRIGRTARAGAEGIAISLVDGEERDYLRDIEKLTRQTIPTLDRRGDASLVVPADDRNAISSESDDRRERGGDRRNGRPHRPAGAKGFERSAHRGSERGRDRSSDRANKPESTPFAGRQSPAALPVNSFEPLARNAAPKFDDFGAAPRRPGTEAHDRQYNREASNGAPRTFDKDRRPNPSREGGREGGRPAWKGSNDRPSGDRKPHFGGGRPSFGDKRPSGDRAPDRDRGPRSDTQASRPERPNRDWKPAGAPRGEGRSFDASRSSEGPRSEAPRSTEGRRPHPARNHESRGASERPSFADRKPNGGDQSLRKVGFLADRRDGHKSPDRNRGDCASRPASSKGEFAGAGRGRPDSRDPQQGRARDRAE
ncbi:MAG: DEAD/DEAH box helicase [Hyphomicrobium sp.]